MVRPRRFADSRLSLFLPLSPSPARTQLLIPRLTRRFDGYSNLEFRRLAMGRLLGSLRETLDAKRRDPLEQHEKTRLHIYSCHDTSLAGILCVPLTTRAAAADQSQSLPSRAAR